MNWSTDKQDEVQKKTFMKWINSVLVQASYLCFYYRLFCYIAVISPAFEVSRVVNVTYFKRYLSNNYDLNNNFSKFAEI